MGPIHLVRRYRRPLFIVYISFFLIRMTIFLILEFIYMIQVQLISAKKLVNKDAEIIKKQNECIYRWMTLMGAHYRSLNATSVLCYSVYVFLVVIYYIMPAILWKYFTKTEDLGPILLLQTPKLSTRLTLVRLNTILKRVMVSNLNYMRSLKLRSSSFQEVTISKASRKLSLFNLDQNDVASRMHKMANEPMLRDHKEKAKQENIKLSYRQFHHLLDLSKNVDSIWPQNRNTTWAKRLERFSTTIFVLSYGSVYFGSQIASLVAQHLVHLSIEEDKSVTHKALSEWNLMDRITLIEDSFVIWFISQKFIIPLTLLVMIVKDQSFFLEKLSQRFAMFYERMMSINDVVSLTGTKSEIFKELQYQCDKEALELYIMFQYFNLEQKSNLKFGEIIINQYICFMLSLTITSLAVISSIESKYFSLMLLLSILIVVVTNYILCLGAAINSDTMRAIRLAWGLLAYSQRRSSKLERKQWFEMGGLGETERRLLSSNSTAYSLISPHTILLWQKIAQGYKHSTERYACRAFGVMNVDYKGILRFNFWVFSGTMLLLSNLFMKPRSKVDSLD